jgi:hypothetical protein
MAGRWQWATGRIKAKSHSRKELIMKFDIHPHALERETDLLEKMQFPAGELTYKFGPMQYKPGYRTAEKKTCPFAWLFGPGGTAWFGSATGKDVPAEQFDINVETFVPTLVLTGDQKKLAQAFRAALELVKGKDGLMIRIEKEEGVEVFSMFAVSAQKVKIQWGHGIEVFVE